MSTQVYELGGYGVASVLNQPIISVRDPVDNVDIVSPGGNPYDIMQAWRNSLTGNVFQYTGGGNWMMVSSNVGPIDTLTGNSGGPIAPTAGNINILGNTTTTVVGSGSTLTITQTAAGFPITPYVVGPVGAAGYQTIQSALTAANAAGGGIVYVQPGSYTENLTLYGTTEVVGVPGNSDSGTTGNTVTITGVHTPPTTGSFTFSGLLLVSATHLFSSAAAGSASLIVENCTINLTNGFVFNVTNWTGPLLTYNVAEIGTNSGAVTNTGGSTCVFISATHGAGTGQTMVTSGPVTMQEVVLNCPWSPATGTTIACDYVIFNHTVTASNNSTGSFRHCTFSTGATAALTQSSTGTILLTDCTITSSNNPAISGVGAGVLTLALVEFTSNTAIAATLTLGTADLVQASSYRTTPLATNVTLSGNTLSSTGSDTNISINVTPKGTGSVVYSASRAGLDLNYQATNSDNTNGASAAGFQAAVGGGTAGDAYSQYAVSGVTTWTTGLDNSASDAYVIAASNALGTSNAASWSTAGALTNTAGIIASTGNIAASAGSVTAATTLTATLGAITATNGNLVLGTAGNKILSTSVGAAAAAGANSFGTVTLVNGTVTVATTAVTAASIIILSRMTVGTTGANDLGILSVGTIVGATSFDINAWTVTNATALQADDQSVIGWMIIN